MSSWVPRTERTREQVAELQALTASAYNEGFADGFKVGQEAGLDTKHELQCGEDAQSFEVSHRKVRAIELE